MLHYIWPPVVIILSLAALIHFLFKKTEGLGSHEVQTAKAGQYYAGKFSLFWTKIGNWLLKFLERRLHGLKLVFLKFHNFSNSLQQVVKRKKAAQDNSLVAAKQGLEEQMEDLTGQAQVVVEIEPEVMVVGTEGENLKYQRKRRTVDVAPKMEENVMVAKVNAEAREGLENALIRRIAINPRDLEAYERLGDYYFDAQNLSDALECYRQVIKLSPVHYKARIKVRKLERMLG